MEESRESGTADRDRDREVEGRYGVLYEQRMNPFAEVIFLLLFLRRSKTYLIKVYCFLFFLTLYY
jgi:hypothetical protein